MEGELELGFLSPARSSCVSSEGGGFGSPTWASPLEKLLNSSSSCVSDSRGNGGGFSSPTWASPLETLLNSPSSCVSDGHGRGNGDGFSSPTWESPLETLLESLSSCVSDGRVGGNGGYSPPLGVLVEQGSEVREAERLLRAIAERYDDCFLRLRDATAELADLRHEHLRISAENLHLSLLLEELEAEQRKQASAVAPTLPLKPVEEEAPRGGAPKSISIRSKGYLSQMQPQGEAEPQRLRRWRRQGRRRCGMGKSRWRWRCTGRARRRRSCATSGSAARAPTAHDAGSRTACRSCAPSSATRATRPSPARCSPPPPATPTDTAATSATHRRPPPNPTRPPSSPTAS